MMMPRPRERSPDARVTEPPSAAAATRPMSSVLRRQSQQAAARALTSEGAEGAAPGGSGGVPRNEFTEFLTLPAYSVLE